MVFENKRASSIFFVLMIGIVFFILGLALTPVIMEATAEASNTGGINCTAGNETQTDQNKAVCTSLDIQQFLFLGTIFGLAGILVSSIALR